MSTTASHEYLKSAVLTASAEKLQLMLYDGAIRFARQAKQAMIEKRLDESCEKLLRAQRIMVQMKEGLRHEINPTLCEKLAQVYDFVYQRLVQANLERKTGWVDEALTLLEHERETWRILLEKIQSHPQAASESQESSHGAPAGEFICLQC